MWGISSGVLWASQSTDAAEATGRNDPVDDTGSERAHDHLLIARGKNAKYLAVLFY
jgi:hypothetical protein